MLTTHFLGGPLLCSSQPACSLATQREKMMELHKFKRDTEDENEEQIAYVKRIPNNDLMRMGKRGSSKNIRGFNFPLRAPGLKRKRAPGMEFVGKRAPGMEFVGKRAPGMEFVGKRSSTELKFFEDLSEEEERKKRPSMYVLDSLL